MDSVRDLHRIVAYGVPTGFALLALWALYSLIRNKDPHPWYWNLLGMLQAVIGVQFIVGGILFLAGNRTDSWRHYFYGAFFPGLVLFFAHRWARGATAGPWLVFGVAGLVCFGLTLMALFTGLGII
jgi:hypothetical protein